MNIIIKATNIELKHDLEEWVKIRLEPLERFDKFLQEKDVEVWVELGKTTKGQRKGDIFRAEAQIRLPGKSIRAEAVSNNVRKSINELRDKLQREVVQYKEQREKKIPNS